MNNQDPQIAVYQRFAPWQRLAAACQLYQFAREIVKTRIKKQDPEMSDLELEKQIRKFF